MSLATILAVLVTVIGFPLNLYVTVRLWTLHRSKPEFQVLHERAFAAVTVLMLVVVFGLVFLNNDLPIPFISLAETKIITRVALLVAAIVPAWYWLRIYRGER